jgi:hypothetical protein
MLLDAYGFGGDGGKVPYSKMASFADNQVGYLAEWPLSPDGIAV